MKALRLILPVLLCAASAFAQDVTYNFDNQADFSKYKTYRWEKHPQSIDVDQITAGKLAAAFDAELFRKGFTKKESGPVDMVIVYQLAITKEKELNSYSTGWGMGPGWRGMAYGGYGYGGSTSTTATISTISIGSISLDMYDAAKQQLVWRGVASKQLDAKVKPDKQEKNMAKAAAKMMKNYPPVKK